MTKGPFHQLHVYQTASLKGKPIYDCYRLMYKRPLWQKAYHQLYPNRKINEFYLQAIDDVISDLRNRRFRFFRNNHVIDHLTLEVMTIILQNIYEPKFRKIGFNYKSYKSLLLQIKTNWHRMTWCMKGEIDFLFDKNHQKLLLTFISEKISDHRFMLLLHNAISRGLNYLANVHPKFVAILLEIYLHKFDLFMEELKMSFVNEAVKEPQNHFSILEEINYVRYQNSFLIGIKSSKKRALIVLTKVSDFLQEKLHIMMNDIVLKHLNKPVSFLGYNIMKRNERQSGHLIHLEITKQKMTKLANRYGNLVQFQAKPRLSLTNKSEYEIMAIYNCELKEIASYYQLANNFHHLQKLFLLAEKSFVKTIAHKRKCSTKQVLLKLKKHRQGRLTVMKKLNSGRIMYESFVQLKELKMKQCESSTGEPYTLKGVRTVLREE